jgi:hypothetical protein
MQSMVLKHASACPKDGTFGLRWGRKNVTLATTSGVRSVMIAGRCECSETVDPSASVGVIEKCG